MITLTVFIALIIYASTKAFDYGKTFDEIIEYTDEQLEIVEDLGVGLIPYDSSVDKILDGMLENIDTLNGAISFRLKIDSELQINGIEPYLTDTQRAMDQTVRAFDRQDLLTNVDFRSGDITQTPEQARLADELSTEWRGQLMKDKSYPEQGDINIMLKTFMPKILSMANKGIPDNIQFSGNSLTVSRSPFGPQNFHQDVDQLALLSSSFAHNEYRIMIFDRDEQYDTEWTQIAIKIDGQKPSQYIKKRFPSYDYAKLIHFELDKSEYIALVFDNNKVFHRTPPTPFWNWVFGNITEKRRVTQFRISWDDNKQQNYIDESKLLTDKSGGGYKIHNRQEKRVKSKRRSVRKNTSRRSVGKKTSRRSVSKKRTNKRTNKRQPKRQLRTQTKMNKHINQNYDLYNGDKWDNYRLGDIINGHFICWNKVCLDKTIKNKRLLREICEELEHDLDNDTDKENREWCRDNKDYWVNPKNDKQGYLDSIHKNYPKSIAAKYVKYVGYPQTYKTFHYPTIQKIFKELKYKKPDKHSLVIHLRLGDTVAKSYGSEYSFGLDYYRELLDEVKQNDKIKKIDIVTGLHKNVYVKQSNQRLNQIIRIFKKHYPVEVILTKNPDKDFYYMCHSKYFAKSGGGFSGLITDIVSRKSSNIIYEL